MTGATRRRLGWLAAWVVACAALTAVEVEFSRGFVNVYAILTGLAFLLAGLGVLIGVVIWAWRRSAVLLGRSAAVLACILVALWTAGGIDRIQAWRSEIVGGRVVEAVERYRRDEGRYPLALAELSPKYLAETPLTCMGIRGRPFRYRSEDGATYTLSFDRSIGLLQVYVGDGRWVNRD